YVGGRFLTITGNQVAGTPDAINPAPRTIAKLQDRIAAHKKTKTQDIKFRIDTGVKTGGFWRNVNEAALASLDQWVTRLFPQAIYHHSTGAWRVTSAAIGRNLQEDLSFAPTGIQDFGRETGLTAIDAVQQWGGAPDAREAALWLCDAMGCDPGALGYAGKASGHHSTIDPTGATQDAPLTYRRASDLDGKPVPVMQWLVDEVAPMGKVTGLNGDGGTGKSLLAMQLAIAVASDTTWLGRKVTAGNAIYFSAEDDDDELHRRIDKVADSMGLSLSDLPNLTYQSFAGQDATLALVDGPTGKLRGSARIKMLHRWIEAEQPAVVVLDTLADLFPGNENDRAQARQFIGMLSAIAIKYKCAVILLAHPSLSGLNSGSGTSGSTGWNNSVRSRLYLERVTQDGYEANPDARVLRTMKANYGRIPAMP
ncbi:MAG: AAA family ATPase, partial [Alphaproteobacteria bacterium]